MSGSSSSSTGSSSSVIAHIREMLSSSSSMDGKAFRDSSPLFPPDDIASLNPDSPPHWCFWWAGRAAAGTADSAASQEESSSDGQSGSSSGSGLSGRQRLGLWGRSGKTSSSSSSGGTSNNKPQEREREQECENHPGSTYSSSSSSAFSAGARGAAIWCDMPLGHLPFPLVIPFSLTRASSGAEEDEESGLSDKEDDDKDWVFDADEDEGLEDDSSDEGVDWGSDDEGDPDREDGGAATRDLAGSRGVFMTRRGVIYGYWSRTPLG